MHILAAGNEVCSSQASIAQAEMGLYRVDNDTAWFPVAGVLFIFSLFLSWGVFACISHLSEGESDEACRPGNGEGEERTACYPR